jgi:hypothetical protein
MRKESKKAATLLAVTAFYYDDLAPPQTVECITTP